MRVLQFIDGLGIGGAERVAITINHLLHAHGIENDILRRYPISGLENSAAQGTRVLDLEAKGKFDWKAMRSLSRICKEYDLIHIHLRGSLQFFYVASKLFGIPKHKVVFHDHYGDIDIDQKISAVMRQAMKGLRYIGVSQALTKWANDIGNVSQDKIFLMENIVLPLSKTQSIDTSSWEPFTWVMVGNFRPTKNQILALHVLKAWNSQNTPKAHLTLIGQPNDQEYLTKVHQTIRDLSLENEVIIRHDVKEPQHELNAFRLGIHTASSETGPLSLIEMMAQHIPFVCTPTGQVPKQIQPTQKDWVSRSWESDEIVDAIQQMISKPFKDRMEESKQLFRAHFGSDVYYKKLMQVYDSKS